MSFWRSAPLAPRWCNVQRSGQVLLLTLSLLLPGAGWCAPAVEGQARVVFTEVKDAVLQIRTLLKGSGSQNSTGSGFSVSDDGLVITNYHVVASHVLDPDAYALEYVTSTGQRGDLTLLAIDVRHDLALVQRTGHALPYLRFATREVARGEKLFSLGNPNDLGMVIVEGVHNGVREHAFYDSLHFTGAINPGMSGGPVVTRAGAVAGVNVASMGESRGFLVPARHAEALLVRWREAGAQPLPAGDRVPAITRQLMAHSAALAQRLAQRPLPTQRDAGYAVPDAADPYMRCWASKSDDPKLFYVTRAYSCSGDSSVFVGEGVSVGSVRFESQLIEGTRLDATRLAALSEQFYARNAGYGADTKQYGAFACTDGRVRTDSMPVQAALCVRPYRKFAGLYDFQFNVATLRADSRAFVTRLNLRGLAYEDGMALVQRYLEALRWSD